MKNKINLLLIFVALTFTSCGLFKNRTVDLVKKSGKTEVSLDSSSKTKVETQDKTKTVIEEKAKGVVYTKPLETVVKSDMQSLLSGLNTVQDSGLFKIIQSYDKITDQLTTSVTVKPQALNYDIDKKTTISNDINSTAEGQVNLKKDSVATFSEKDKHTKSEVSKTFVIVVAIAASVLLALIVIYVKNKMGA